MKNGILILFMFLFSLGLSACVQNQNTDNTAYTTPYNQNINDTNYQEMLREQSARASVETGGHSFGGRR